MSHARKPVCHANRMIALSRDGVALDFNIFRKASLSESVRIGIIDLFRGHRAGTARRRSSVPANRKNERICDATVRILVEL